jgi:hypothetical protein
MAGKVRLPGVATDSATKFGVVALSRATALRSPTPSCLREIRVPSWLGPAGAAEQLLPLR